MKSGSSSVAVIAMSILLVACDQPEPVMSEQEIAEFRKELPGITEKCLDIIRMGGIDAVPIETDKCFQMMPSRRWVGLWHDEFEEQRFCPSPANECSFDTPGERVWITFNRDVAAPTSTRAGAVYAVEFIGRRTLRPGHHGHLGVFDHAMIVDDVISLKRQE
ncbi:hypothetical protein [Sphingomonas sp. AX6]|uniref:hypothetical protein n=1 Tax=Sphingomonas sp. AX6 TaxID=2653171 RepID=UPI001F455C79|nr:hypothetical protein [Sphingomonas sp. AX6]